MAKGLIVKATIKISKEEQKKFAKFIMTQIVTEMLNKIAQSMGTIKINVQNYIKTQFFSSLAVRSMTDDYGTLKGDLGLDDAIGGKLETILETVLSNIDIQLPTRKVFSKYVRITYLWRILPIGYNDLLGLGISGYISEKSGENIPWLAWLLNGTPGIQGYGVARWSTGDRGTSRSGIAIMWKGRGRSWKMPAEFAGTAADNFLTRIFDEIGVQITKEVDKVISA